MKKIISIVAIATISMFAVSCGNGAAEAQRKADSAKVADSTRNAFVTDSTSKAVSAKRVSDSLANVAAAAETKRIADSTLAAATKKPVVKPKTAPAKQKEENKKATGGRG